MFKISYNFILEIYVLKFSFQTFRNSTALFRYISMFKFNNQANISYKKVQIDSSRCSSFFFEPIKLDADKMSNFAYIFE